MRTEDFYGILDGEISDIVDRFSDLPAIAKYKDVNQKKSYGFLIWFLEFYGGLNRFSDYITNGHNDASCDIIFSRLAANWETVFYVVQSKWANRKNAMGQIKANDVKYSLNDFQVVIQGKKQKTGNPSFDKSYRDLREHLAKNGKVRFIILALANENDDYKDNVASFRRDHYPNCSLDVIDIERMKRDYIDQKYKHLLKESPLEPHFDPDSTKITLRFERFADIAGKGDMIVKKNGFRAYVMMVKPGFLHSLFNTYGFSLFYRNIRNPLPETNFNEQIADTLKKRPPMFWYFNNGITAVAKIIPEIGNEAREVEVTGFQVINGAQTIYSIYRAYEETSEVSREAIDNDALIMLRLVNSNDVDFNYQITRFTNSQNPMIDRDFLANDPVQEKMQNDSFNYPYWYEKRRGEFKIIPEGTGVIGNHTLAVAYMAVYMEDIYSAVTGHHLMFMEKEIYPGGLYEKVFNIKELEYENMLASYLFIEKILDLIYPERKKPAGNTDSWDLEDEHILLALAVSPAVKMVLEAYLAMKLDRRPDVVKLTRWLVPEDKIENDVFENICLFTLRHLDLVDDYENIDFMAFVGQEIIKESVDRIYDMTKRGKDDLLLSVRQLREEFFEQDKNEVLITLKESPLEPRIKNPQVIKLTNDVLQLRREEKFDTALLLIERMNQLEPKNCYIFKEWGMTYKEKKEYDKALVKLEEALKLCRKEKQRAGIHIELGDLHTKTGNESQAQIDFEKSEALEPENPVLYDRWAFLYYQTGKYQEAMNKITIAVKLDSKNDVYKWKFEFYAKKYSDKHFTIEMAKFLKNKKEAQSKMKRWGNDRLSPYSRVKTPRPSLSNYTEDFERFLGRYNPKDIVEGEVIHVHPQMGVYIRMDFDVVGLIYKKRLPSNFDINVAFKPGTKLKVKIVFIKYDKRQVDLDLAD